MKRGMPLTTILIMLLATLLWTADAWARVGGGGSSGSRGSRSYSAPARPAPGPGSPSRPAAPPSSFQQPAPQRPGWTGGLLGGIGGLLLGGLLGSLLFGGLGQGLFGGIGLIEILIITGLLYFAFSHLRRRTHLEPAAPPGYATPQRVEADPWRPAPVSASTATLEAPASPGDLDRGLGHIRQMDPTFDPGQFAANTASDAFFKIQAAWMAREMGSVRQLLTPEMHTTLQGQCDHLRAERRINRLENIAVRSAEVTETWQEGGQDFVTVRFLASVLDYTVNESGQVVEGSQTEPVKFEEYWTFVRPVGPNPWRLGAIQQAA